MVKFCYIRLNPDNTVKGICCLSGEVNQVNMIPIDENTYDGSLIGKKYENGEFI